ncbi:hypothetical protein AB9K35_01130 [Leisingera sp. XS_AS12]
MIERPDTAVFGGTRNVVVCRVLSDCPFGQSRELCDSRRPEPRFHRFEDIGRFLRNRNFGLIGLNGHLDASGTG